MDTAAWQCSVQWVCVCARARCCVVCVDSVAHTNTPSFFISFFPPIFVSFFVSFFPDFFTIIRPLFLPPLLRLLFLFLSFLSFFVSFFPSFFPPFFPRYYPVQIPFEESRAMMVDDAPRFKTLVQETLVRHANAINKLTARGMRFWDYGNSFLLECRRAGADVEKAGATDGKTFRYPSYVAPYDIYINISV